MNNPGNLAT